MIQFPLFRPLRFKSYDLTFNIDDINLFDFNDRKHFVFKLAYGMLFPKHGVTVKQKNNENRGFASLNKIALLALYYLFYYYILFNIY